MGVVIYNGQSSEDFGLHVTYRPDYDLPVRDVEEITLPGKDGTILYDNGRYDKTERKYAMTFGDEDVDFYDMAIKMSKWLNSSPSKYVRLSDSYEPYVYRLARFVPDGPILPVLENAGGLEVKFECLPQRFYKEGGIPLKYDIEPVGANFFHADDKDDEKSTETLDVYRLSLDYAYPYVLYPYLKAGDEYKARIYYYLNNVETSITIKSDGSFVSPVEDPNYDGVCYLELVKGTYRDRIGDVDIREYELLNFFITNYTDHSAKPIIRITPKLPDSYRDGIYEFDLVAMDEEIERDSYKIVIDLRGSNGYDGVIILDCEQKDCYGYDANNNLINLNPYVTFTKNNMVSGFPVLVPGKNLFRQYTKSYEISVEVTPNWWTI